MEKMIEIMTKYIQALQAVPGAAEVNKAAQRYGRETYKEPGNWIFGEQDFTAGALWVLERIATKMREVSNG